MTGLETSAVTWGGTELSYTIRRSARREKTIAVTVDPAGSILVVAPERVGTDRLDTIVGRKAEWIVRRIRRAESHGPLLSPREFVSGESVRYLGRHYRLKVDAGETGSAKLRGGWLHVPAPGGSEDAARVRAGLVSWFRRRAAERLPERIEAWRAKAGVPMPRIKVVSQAKRWGSCDQAGTVRLNWRIIQAPMRLVDYVVVHELVHLRHRGHGRDYWQAVGRVMPDYERRRRDLRERGAFLVW
ncbi:MAG: M48 family metallopeptidase [Acidobacteria bacterium]|nr:M48 family metallopeptidase [Acidobacteriota bacterium]